MAGPITNHECMKAHIEAKGLPDASPVPGGAKTAMVPVAPLPRRTGMLGRVADFGDLSEGTPLPYEPEIQAEIVAQRTEREDLPPS